MAKNDGAVKKSAPPRPTIDLPPREDQNPFRRGVNASPGPMTLVSAFFCENDPESECRSFSQLLAGAMSSPGARRQRISGDTAEAEPVKGRDSDDTRKEGGGFRSKENRPIGLVMAPSTGPFLIPPGFSPGGFLDSPGLFSAGKGHFAMISHQQALAQVTSQAVQSQSHMIRVQAEYSSAQTVPTVASSSCNTQPAAITIPLKQNHCLPFGGKISNSDAPDISRTDQRSHPVVTMDKPSDDGFNWRKYGQKQVKGGEFPRSYYKCSYQKCPVKKKVERSSDGQITEIIYKGEHNHPKPLSSRRAKEDGLVPYGSANANGKNSLPASSEMDSQCHSGNFGQSEEIVIASSLTGRDQESDQVTHEQLSDSSDGEEVTDAEVRAEYKNEPDLKRRCTDARVTESHSYRTAVSEPRIIVQTTSEVDLLDDGYRWRKYGQKLVKGNPYPRSYYKCTYDGCNVRKHVERASSDPKAVITTYEGKHSHDVPVGRSSSHGSANAAAAASGRAQIKSHNVGADKHLSLERINFKIKSVQQPTFLAQMKEEPESI